MGIGQSCVKALLCRRKIVIGRDVLCGPGASCPHFTFYSISIAFLRISSSRNQPPTCNLHLYLFVESLLTSSDRAAMQCKHQGACRWQLEGPRRRIYAAGRNADAARGCALLVPRARAPSLGLRSLTFNRQIVKSQKDISSSKNLPSRFGV